MVKKTELAPGFFIVRKQVAGKPRYLLMRQIQEKPLIIAEVHPYIEWGEAAKQSHLLYNTERGVVQNDKSES